MKQHPRLSVKDNNAELKWLKRIADIKWAKGYVCRQCKRTEYYLIKSDYSRRCKKCTYEETPIMNTAFENSKIPVSTKMEFLLEFHYRIYQEKRGEPYAYRVPLRYLVKKFKVNENSIIHFFKKIYDFIYAYDLQENKKWAHTSLPDYGYGSNFESTFVKGLKTDEQRQVYYCLFELLMEDTFGNTMPRDERDFLPRLITGTPPPTYAY